MFMITQPEWLHTANAVFTKTHTCVGRCGEKGNLIVTRGRSEGLGVKYSLLDQQILIKYRSVRHMSAHVPERTHRSRSRYLPPATCARLGAGLIFVVGRWVMWLENRLPTLVGSND